MLLNADLGEGFDDIDRKVMPFIDQANIACGGHAGNKDSIAHTIRLALQRDVAIGAHPSYEDTEHFGRRSLDVGLPLLEQQLFTQVERVANACAEAQCTLNHIKAHGALYNDSQIEPEKMRILMRLAKAFRCDLMIQSRPDMASTIEDASKLGIALIFEGFADRAYNTDGSLVSRNKQGAVYHDVNKILAQGLTFASAYQVRCIDGVTLLTMKIDSLCVHGDNDVALHALTALYDALHRT